MQCPTCGAIAPGNPTSNKPRSGAGGLADIVKQTLTPGNKLKSLRQVRTRPDGISSGKSMTRGGRYARD